MLYLYVGTRSLPLSKIIYKELCYIIIDYMMFYTYYLDGITQTCLLAIFLSNLNYSEDVADAGNVSLYAIVISNTNQFQLVANYLSSGILFHQVVQVMVNMKDLLGIRSN